MLKFVHFRIDIAVGFGHILTFSLECVLLLLGRQDVPLPSELDWYQLSPVPVFTGLEIILQPVLCTVHMFAVCQLILCFDQQLASDSRRGRS